MSETWIGKEVAFEAPEYEETYEKGLKRATAVWHGQFAACQAAVIEPDGAALVPGSGDCVLKRCRLARGDGGSGTVTFEGERTDPSTPSAPASAPSTVRIRLIWTPRQVPLERGRATALGSTFDYALLEYWKRTEDYRLKKAFKALVPVLYGENPTEGEKLPAEQVYGAAQVEIVSLDGVTKPIAERIAIGMESYEDYYPVVSITKTWAATPPAGALVKPGVQGNPPAFPPAADLSEYKWICCSGEVNQTGAREWTTTNAWTGLLPGAAPAAPPTGWGSTPFDGRYYP